MAFVLLVNRDQIESYVNSIYGEKVDARAYLLKFANLFVDLPNQQPVLGYRQDRQKFARSLLAHYDFTEGLDEGDFVARSIDVIVEHFELTLREIEKMFLIMNLYYSSLPKNQLTNGFLVVMLAALKVNRPELYAQLRKGSIESEDFLKTTRLDKIRERDGDGVSQDWILNMLKFCLLSEQKMRELEKDSLAAGGERNGPLRLFSWLSRFDFNRKKVIPFFVSRLDQFSYEPKG